MSNEIGESVNGTDQCPTQKIPEDNPFRDQIIDLASDGYSWGEIWQKLEEAYNPVDRAAFEESFEEENNV